MRTTESAPFLRESLAFTTLSTRTECGIHSVADSGAAESLATAGGDAPLVQGAAGHICHVDSVGHHHVIEVNHAAFVR